MPAFLKTTENYYGAGLKEVDFINGREEARQTINAWVEEQTKDKIKEIIKPDILTEDTRLVLGRFLTNVAIHGLKAWMRTSEKKTASISRCGRDANRANRVAHGGFCR